MIVLKSRKRFVSCISVCDVCRPLEELRLVEEISLLETLQTRHKRIYVDVVGSPT